MVHTVLISRWNWHPTRRDRLVAVVEAAPSAHSRTLQEHQWGECRGPPHARGCCSAPSGKSAEGWNRAEQGRAGAGLGGEMGWPPVQGNYAIPFLASLHSSFLYWDLHQLKSRYIFEDDVFLASERLYGGVRINAFLPICLPSDAVQGEARIRLFHHLQIPIKLMHAHMGMRAHTDTLCRLLAVPSKFHTATVFCSHSNSVCKVKCSVLHQRMRNIHLNHPV